MNKSINIRLSIMMFLEFFIWGCWFVTMGTFLSQSFNSSGAQIGLAYETQSWGAIIAPFIIGLIADRYFDAEKILALIHIIGGGLLFMCSIAMGFESFFPYILIYMILYMPTLALVNSISFRQMSDPSKEFPKIRVWGTIGWVVAGLVISYGVGWEASQTLEYTFYLAAIVSVILGVFSFTLPKTPPKGKNSSSPSLKEILGLDALKLLNDSKYLIFFISSILISIPLSFYYADANLFLAYDPGNKNTYLRYSYDGIFPNTGEYCDSKIDPQRWARMRDILGLNIKPWKKHGDYILVTCQRDGGWSMNGQSVIEWLHLLLQRLKAHTDRPIMVRFHPGDKKIAKHMMQLQAIGHKVRFSSPSVSLLKELHDA